VIRPFSLRDAPEIRRLQAHRAAFDLKRSLLTAADPTRSAVLGLVSGYRLGARTLVHTGTEGPGPIAYVQLAPREDGSSWDVLSLAPTLDQGEQVQCLWQDLLCQSVVVAAKESVARVYARLPVDDVSALVLRRSGFSLVTCEEVFVSGATQPHAEKPLGLRNVAADDAWALDELRRQVIPPLVYQAQWLVPEEATPTAQAMGTAQLRLVWSDQDRILAYFSLESTPRGHWLECVVRPEHRAELLPHLRYLIHVAGAHAERPVYVPVPDYAIGLGWLLRTLGFESAGRQQVLVAHTVSRVTVTRPVAARGLEGHANLVAH